jgi:hypothetical protein
MIRKLQGVNLLFEIKIRVCRESIGHRDRSGIGPVPKL